MTPEKLETQLADIQNKLDEIGLELAARKRQRQEMEELKDDLSIVAKDVFQTAVVELEDVAPFVSTGDFLHLIKKILRNTHAISNSISQFESTLDFFRDARPISSEIFCDVLHKLDDLDRKGYPAFGKEILKAFDTIVEKFSPEEIRTLVENFVFLLELMQFLAESNLLPALKRTVQAVKEVKPEQFDTYSLFKANRELMSPEMRRASGLTMHFIKTLIQEASKEEQKQ